MQSFDKNNVNNLYHINNDNINIFSYYKFKDGLQSKFEVVRSQILNYITENKINKIPNLKRINIHKITFAIPCNSILITNIRLYCRCNYRNLISNLQGSFMFEIESYNLNTINELLNNIYCIKVSQ